MVYKELSDDDKRAIVGDSPEWQTLIEKIDAETDRHYKKMGEYVIDAGKILLTRIPHKIKHECNICANLKGLLKGRISATHIQKVCSDRHPEWIDQKKINKKYRKDAVQSTASKPELESVLIEISAPPLPEIPDQDEEEEKKKREAKRLKKEKQKAERLEKLDLMDSKFFWENPKLQMDAIWEIKEMSLKDARKTVNQIKTEKKLSEPDSYTTNIRRWNRPPDPDLLLEGSFDLDGIDVAAKLVKILTCTLRKDFRPAYTEDTINQTEADRKKAIVRMDIYNIEHLYGSLKFLLRLINKILPELDDARQARERQNALFRK